MIAKYKFIFLLFLITVFSFSAVVLSGYWRDKNNLRNVKLSGNTTISKGELFSFAHLSDSLLMSNSLPLKTIEERISKHQNIKNVIVKTDGTDMIIEVAEKDPFAIVTNGKQLFLVDDAMNVYGFRKENNSLNIPVVSGMKQDFDINNISSADFDKLRVAHFIISKMVSMDKMLFNYISEIAFTEPSQIILYTYEDAVPVYFVDYGNLKVENTNLNLKDNINNKVLQDKISEKLVLLYNFIKQVSVYKQHKAFNYVDLRYNDIVIVKNR